MFEVLKIEVMEEDIKDNTFEYPRWKVLATFTIRSLADNYVRWLRGNTPMFEKTSVFHKVYERLDVVIKQKYRDHEWINIHIDGSYASHIAPFRYDTLGVPDIWSFSNITKYSGGSYRLDKIINILTDYNLNKKIEIYIDNTLFTGVELVTEEDYHWGGEYEAWRVTDKFYRGFDGTLESILIYASNLNLEVIERESENV